MAYLDNTGLAHFWAGIKEKLAAKADLASPALTGTPTAPTPAAGDNSTQIATTEFVCKKAQETGENTVTGKFLHVTDAKALTAVKSLTLYNSYGTVITTGRNISVANKNLFRIDLIPSSSTSLGLTFVKNPDGGITAVGTTTGTYASTTCALEKSCLAVGQTYTLSSGKSSGTLYVQVAVFYTDSTTDYFASRSQATTFTITKEVSMITASVQVTDAGVTVNETVYPQLEVGGTATAFENNSYTNIYYDGTNLPLLPATISNVWSNADDVASMTMVYYTDTAAAHAEEEAKATSLAVMKQNKLTAGEYITIDDAGTISADKDSLVNAVIEALPNGDEVSY